MTDQIFTYVPVIIVVILLGLYILKHFKEKN